MDAGQKNNLSEIVVPEKNPTIFKRFRLKNRYLSSSLAC